MKALTNILNYILLLMMIFITSCIEDTAEVDNLMQQGKYVSVRMQVPGMKAATTRATAEDNITSVVALVFRDDALISKTEVTTAASTLSPATTTTGSFKIEMPKSGDVIHFLANLPDAIKNNLPETGDSQTDVLRNLETNDREKLSYWGKATYSSGETLDVTLYRNMAKIEIVPGTECTFPEDELFIAGLVNANQKGALVPYDEGFNFDLETSEPTLPAEPNPLAQTDELTNFGSGYDSSYYVFEHDNPETEDGLYVICKIGKYYYKVALIDDTTGKPYDIVRNHRYVIYVNDLDEGVADYETALTADPVNFVVKKIQDVTISPTAAQTINYGEELSVTVSVPNGSTLNNLAITADGFTIKQGSTTLGTGSYENNSLSYTNTTLTYTFVPTSVGSKRITITGSGDYLNDFAQTIEVSVQKAAVTFQYTDNQTINLNEGYLDVQMNGVPNGSTVTLTITASDFEVSAQNDTQLTHDGDVWTYVGTATNFRFTPTSEGEKNISITGEGENVNVTPAEIRVTVVDSSIKVTSGTINMDNSETSTTLTLTKPTDVQNIRFNIAGANDKFAVSVNGNNLQFDNNNNCFAIQNNGENVEITFTAQGNVAAGAYTVTFWDANNQEMVTTGIITVVNTPKLQYEYSNNATLYMDSNPQFPVTITVPDGSTLTQLNISAEGFTVTASTEGLSGSDGSYTYSGGSTTFTFVPTSAGDKTITFSGSGTNLNVPEETISVKVEATKPREIILIDESSPVTIDWNPYQLPYANLEAYKGKIMYAIVQISNDNSRQIRFENNNYGGIAIFEQASLPANTETTLEVTIPSDLSNYMQIRGFGVTIKKLYIIP